MLVRYPNLALKDCVGRLRGRMVDNVVLRVQVWREFVFCLSLEDFQLTGQQGGKDC